MNRIQKLRLYYGLTQKELGEVIGVTDRAISAYENGKRNPKKPNIDLMAKRLHVSPGYLMGNDIDCYFCYDRYNGAEFGQPLTVDGAEVKLDLRHKRLLISDGDFDGLRMSIKHCPFCGRELWPVNI